MTYFRALFLAAALVGCVTPLPDPVPTPPPVPDPNDPFVGAVLDCTSPEVAAERPALVQSVAICLTGDAPAPCLVLLTDRATPSAIGCEVRDQGVRASSSVAGGEALPTDVAVATHAREWIREKGVSYR
jgi:hypothetical protein